MRDVDKEEIFACPFCGAPYRELIPADVVQVKCRYCGATVLVPPKLGGLLQRCPSHPGLLAVGICNDCSKSFCGNCLFVIDTLIPSQKTGGYLYVCSDCVKRRIERAALITIFFLFLISGLLFASITRIFGPVFLVMALATIAIMVYHSKRYESLPTVRSVMEKVSELNKRVEKVKATFGPREAEDLYRRMVWGSISYERSRIDGLLEGYMQSGLSRKEAVLKIAGEEGVAIIPGLHAPPTMGDALSELKKEMKTEIKKGRTSQIKGRKRRPKNRSFINDC